MLRTFYDPDKPIRERYCRSLTSGFVLHKGKEEEVEAFVKMRSLLLKREVEQGRLDSSNNEIKVRIRFGTKIAVYNNPNDSRVNGTIDLAAVEDPDTQDAIKKYFRISGGEKYHYNVEANSKGKVGGKAPLNKVQRDGKVEASLEKLSKGALDHARNDLLPEVLKRYHNPLQRAVITRRLLFIEYFPKKMLEKIDLCMKLINQELQTARDPNIQRSLHSEMTQLNRLKEQIENMDYYALCKVLLFYPIGNPSEDHQKQTADAIFNNVCQDIRGTRFIAKRAATKIPIIGGAFQSNLSPIEEAYAKDVAAMARLDRASYFKHCDDHKLDPKAEGMADLFLREALEFSMKLPTESDGGYSKEGEYQAEGFQKTAFLKDFAQPLKTNIQNELKQLGITATYAIGLYQGDEYHISDPKQPDPNATDAEKKKLEKENAQKQAAEMKEFKKHIAAHRARVDYSATYEKKHRVNDTPPLSTNMIDTSMEVPEWIPLLGGTKIPIQMGLLTGTTAALTIVKEITPTAISSAISSVMPQRMLDLWDYGTNHPGQLLVVATGVEKLSSWFFEVERVGPEGTAKRTIHYKRILLAGAAVGGTLGLAYYAPETLMQYTAFVTNFLKQYSLLPAVSTVGNAVGSLKSYFFMPLDYAVKVGLGLFAVNTAAPKLSSYYRGKNYAAIGAVGGLAALMVMSYRAATDGVVDHGLMEYFGTQGLSLIQAASHYASQFFNYGAITSWASYYAVGKLLEASTEAVEEDPEATIEQRTLKAEAQKQAASGGGTMQAIMMGGVPLNQMVRAGKGTINRVLPKRAVSILNVPMNLATRFSGNVDMVTKGSMLAKPVTGLISGVYSVASGIFGRLSDMAKGVGEAYTTAQKSGPVTIL